MDKRYRLEQPTYQVAERASRDRRYYESLPVTQRNWLSYNGYATAPLIDHPGDCWIGGSEDEDEDED